MNDNKYVDEDEAIEALECLGLTKYEAKVFIALQRLGIGGARDVAQVVDVPRPQVYTTAESLKQRGLIDIQQSTPIQYRAIEIEEAETKLRNRFERTHETAFEYLRNVSTDQSEDKEQQTVWTITGRETVHSRITHLVGKSEQDILFGLRSASLLRERTINALCQVAANGVSVTIISRDPAIRECFGSTDGINVVEPSIKKFEGMTGCLLVVDDNTVLLSVLGEGNLGVSCKTAIWSSETEFAYILVQLVKNHLQS